LQELNREEQQEVAKRAYPINPNQPKLVQNPTNNYVSPAYNINKTSYPSSIRKENDAAQMHPWLRKTQYGGKRKSRKSKKTRKTKKSRKY
jgi:hypothetical protein